MVFFVPPAPSVRARTRLPGLGPGPAWSSARRMISTWSAGVGRARNARGPGQGPPPRTHPWQWRGGNKGGGGGGPPWPGPGGFIAGWGALGGRPRTAGANHARRALRLLRCQCRGRTMRSGGRSPSPFLKGRGRILYFSEWTPTRVVSMSITGGRSAQTPAAGECSPAGAHARCLAVLRARPRRPRRPRRGRPGSPPAVRPWGRRQRTRGSPSRAAARGPTGNGLPGSRAPPDPP